MSTAELTGLLQEGQQEGEGELSHEGIVLHDAPLLGRQSPASQAQPEGTHYSCLACLHGTSSSAECSAVLSCNVRGRVAASNALIRVRYQT